jgi:hypothetical protein
MNYSVWDLVGVSKHWRHVAFTTPHLWNAFTIEAGSEGSEHEEINDGDHLHIYVGKRHVCREPAHMRSILDRCGSLYLDVAIKGPMYGRKPDLEDMIKCLKLLNCPSIMKKVMFLELEGCTQEMVTCWPDCFRDSPLQHLQKLVIRCSIPDEWRKNLFSSVSDTTTRLQTLIVHSSFDSNIFPDRIWLGIKFLKIGGHFISSQIDEWLDNASHLEELSCSYWPSSTTPRRAFPSLTKIALHCTPGSIRRLHLPVLQNLHASDYRVIRSPEPFDPMLESATYPTVYSMDIESYRPDQWLTNISAPRLTTLNLRIERSYKHNVDFKNASLATLTSITTINIASDVKDSVTIAILEELPNVTSTTLSTLNLYHEYALPTSWN